MRLGVAFSEFQSRNRETYPFKCRGCVSKYPHFTNNSFNLGIEKLILSSEANLLEETVQVAGFNLGIEKLILSSMKGSPVQRLYLRFQSRNRETYPFKSLNGTQTTKSNEKVSIS